jgi:hypothetical protein
MIIPSVKGVEEFSFTLFTVFYQFSSNEYIEIALRMKRH